MAVRLAESLVRRKRFDAGDAAGRYLEWWREGAFDTGPVTGRVLELMASGLSANEASSRVHGESGGLTAGCNPAHRSSPLAMLGTLADEDLPEAAMAEAAITHHDPLAGDASTAVCLLGRFLIKGLPWEEALDRAVRGRRDRTREAMNRGGEDPGTSGGFSPEVLRATTHFVDASSGFREALDRSLSFAGPANYSPVLVGALAGARWGASSIPTRALGHVSVLPRIRQAAEALAGTWLGR